MFESNNHVLQKMFHGTQHVPKQIVEFYMAWKKIPQLAKGSCNEKTSPAVHSLFEKLTDVKHFTSDAHFTNGVRGVGTEKPVLLDASQILAVQVLLGLAVQNIRGVMYSRFVASNKLFSCVSYVRSKQHINHNITFEHERYTYGVILGLYAIKPTCLCSIAELQYCNCSSFNVVLI